MASGLFIYLLSGLGLGVAFLLLANCFYNLYEYSPVKKSVITGLFLGLCCFVFNAYSFSLNGSPVLDLRFVLLILTAICFESRVFYVFAPLYVASVWLSPFSVWFAIAEVAISFVILMIRNGNKAVSALFIPAIVPLAFSEIYILGYIQDYNAKLLLTFGVGAGFLIVVLFLGLLALVNKNVLGAVFGLTYFRIVLSKNEAMYPFKINRAGNTVTLSKRCADYFEFGKEKLTLLEFSTILEKSTDAKITVKNNKIEEGLFVTLNTRKDLYIRYACLKRFLGGYKGFFYDITSSTPRFQMLSQAVERDYTTGLPTFSVLKESILNIAKNAKGNMLFISIELQMETFQKSVYDVEFEYSCYRYLAELLKMHFFDAGLYSIKSGNFVMVIPNLEKSDSATDSISKLKDLLNNTYTIGNRKVLFNAILGVYRTESVRITGFNEVNDALQRLFFCKSQAAMQKNKNYYSFMQEQYDEYLEDQFRIRDLETIFKSKQIYLVYQPIVDILLSKPIIYEVLVRVNHEKYRDTKKFVKDCIDCGLDIELDNMVISELLRLLKNGMQPQNLSINLLGNTPIGTDLAEISNILNKSGKTLFLEFTEYINTDITDFECKICDAIKIGAKIVIDDFGTQYSNYELLNTLHFDIIKIPIEFIEGVATSKRKQFFVKMVVDYSKEFGVLCVAEGMENAEDLATLKSLSIRYFQGYFFARPLKEMPADSSSYIVNLPPILK